MVNTGFISFVIEMVTPGQDINGNMQAGTKVDSAYFNCNIETVRKEFKTLVDGQWLDSAFKIIIDSPLVSEIDLETVKEVKLLDGMSNPLGDFQVQNIEYLNVVQRIKIVV